MASTAPPLLARDLHKSYGETHALDGFDLTVAPGTIHALLGPNGAGKTTASVSSPPLRAATAARSERRRPRRRDATAPPCAAQIGLVGQSTALDEVLFGDENLVMLGRLHGLTTTHAQVRADELLDDLRAGRGRWPQGVDVLRGHAPTARHRRQPHPPTRACSSSTSRPPGSTRVGGRGLGDRTTRGRARDDGAAHHPVPRRGRPARRPGHRHGSGQGDRRGHLRRS